MSPSDLAPLTVIATPIGNLGDLAPRAADALRDADLVACEDTRRTATLLRHAGSEAPMVALHKHNEAGRGDDLVRRMADGVSIALVSDAGMPSVSDPGARVVAAARQAGLAVSVIPGPSAVETALASSGFIVNGYLFTGFLPRRDAERAELWTRLDEASVAAVAFESPSRLAASLASLSAHEPARRVAVCRELTKLHEETRIGTAQELAALFSAEARGEITLVIDAPAGAAQADETALAEGLSIMLAGGLSPRAAASVATALGAASRNAAYRLATELSAET